MLSRILPYQAFLITSISALLVIVFGLRIISQRDPTSAFFDPAKGYEPIYSKTRQHQAESFIQSIVADTSRTPVKYDPAERDDAICIGIATVARKNVGYFNAAVGSLLEGLDASERHRINLILFIANSDPNLHPAYDEGWMSKVADQVLVYNATSDPEEFKHILDLEATDTEYREKPLYDYVHLLNACLDTGTPYLAIIEDDVIALDGWYHRTKKAIAEVTRKAESRHGAPDFLYLRLFFTEQFLGWNKENWLSYFSASVVAFAFLGSSLLGVRKYAPRTQKYLTNQTILTLCLVHLPVAIVFFFLAGRMVVWPFPSGVVQMNNFGCCSQGLVFSRTKVPDLIEWYQEKRIGFLDMLTEEYGDKTGTPRWAISPSVLQHIGSYTSKGEELADIERLKDPYRKRTVAETIWNFNFELNDAVKLKHEHDSVLREARGRPLS